MMKAILWVLGIVVVAPVVVAILPVGFEVDYGTVPMPREGTYAVGDFVAEINREMIDNEHRVKDWVKHGRVFRLRLPDVIVGDDTLTYKAGNWLSNPRQAVFIECSFESTRPVRRISNRDTVDIEGRTVVAEQTERRIELMMDRCQVDRVEEIPQQP